MKIIFLGTCAGTEPMPARKHTSLLIEHNGSYYLFDAGEGCGRTAHLMGLDLSKINNIFISHTHMDHIGGLANLLWYQRKLKLINNIHNYNINIYTPNISVWHHIWQMLLCTEDNFKIDYTIIAKEYEDGTIFNDGNIQIKAQHNFHLGKPAADEKWRSFSFRIETKHKTIVLSGDIDSIQDLTPILHGVDLLIVETGHNNLNEICSYLNKANYPIQKLILYHHGREILKDPKKTLLNAQKKIDKEIIIAEDRMVYEVN